MDKLVTMIQDAGNLYDALVEMREKQETKTGGSETDFKRLYFCAKSAPFHGHQLENQSEFVRRAYLRLLAGLVSQTEDSGRRETKIIHIGRILAAMPDGDLDSLFTDAATITTEDLESFRESLPEELRLLFLFDLLLLCWLDGEPEEAELQYAVGFMSAFAIPQKQSEALAKAVRAVLGLERDTLLGLVGEIDVLLFACYLDQSECLVVSTLEEARQVKGKSVVVFNAEIENLDLPIDMDTFPAESVEFRSCTFWNMQGLFAEDTPVKIVDCLFKECKVERNLLALCNAEIRDTDFVKCKATNMNQSEFDLFALRNSTIENCTFQQILIQCNGIVLGGLLGMINSTAVNCLFQECEWNGSHFGYQWLISIKGGQIAQCNFIDCSLSGDACLFNVIDAKRENNTVKDCSYTMEAWNCSNYVLAMDKVLEFQRARIKREPQK